jgi:hypothetical protein
LGDTARIGAGISAAPAMTRQNAATRAVTAGAPDPSGAEQARGLRSGWRATIGGASPS